MFSPKRETKPRCESGAPEGSSHRAGRCVPYHASVSHHLAEGVAAIDLVVAEALQYHELLGLAGARIHGFALLRRHQAVVVGGDEQDRPRRDALDHPFGIEAERVVDELERHLRHCRCIVAPRRRAQFGRLAVRQQHVVAVGKLGVAGERALHTAAAARSSRSWYSSGRRTLRIQRAPLPMPTTETTHLTRGSMAATNTTVAPP